MRTLFGKFMMNEHNRNPVTLQALKTIFENYPEF